MGWVLNYLRNKYGLLEIHHCYITFSFMAQQLPRWANIPPPGLAQFLAMQQPPEIIRGVQPVVEQPAPQLQSTPPFQPEEFDRELSNASVSHGNAVVPPSPQVTTGSEHPTSSQSTFKKAKGAATPFTLPLWLTTSGPWESVDHAVSDINRQWALCDE
jgi:hypothetical protein